MKAVPRLLILAAILALSYGENYSGAGPNHPINVKLRQSYSNYMDKSVNPCFDFFKYSCGNWSNFHAENLHKYNSVQLMLNYEVASEFIEYMENTQMSDKPDFVKNAYNFYASCRDTSEFRGLPVMNWLEEHENMKWVLRMKTVDKNATFDWVHTLALMRQYGMNKIFVTTIVYDNKTDPSDRYVELSNPVEKYGFRFITDYEMERLNNAVVLPEGVKNITEFYNEIKEFENILRTQTASNEGTAEEVMKVKDLPFPWLSRYLAVVLEDESLDPDMKITIKDITYMEDLENILKNYDGEFLQRYLEVSFLLYVGGISFINDEWDCIHEVRGFMPLAMHWIYEQMHPELEQEIPKVHHMFDNILKYVNKTLRSDKSNLVPDTLLTKLDTMQLKVGNLPRQDTIKALDAFYSTLSLKHMDYFVNYLQLLKLSCSIENLLSVDDMTTKFNEFVDKTEKMKWNYVLPRYIPVSNTLIVPSYQLRPPIYHWAYGDFFKLSSLGSVMAKYVYSALQMDGFSIFDMDTIAGMGGVHTTYEMFFSTSVPVNMSEYQSIVDEIEVPLKQMFFISAAQYDCAEDRPNLAMTDLTEFRETFNCNNLKFRKILEN